MAEEKQYSLTLDINYFVDQEGVSYESPENWLWVGILGGCGCGSSDQLAKKAWKLLEHFATDHALRNLDIYTDDSYEILAHWMAKENLTEHGGSVGGSWLSPKVKQIYTIIAELKGKYTWT